jgi:hypothetical protein
MKRPGTSKALPRLKYTLKGVYIYSHIAYNDKTTTLKSTGLRIEKGERWNGDTNEIVGNDIKTQVLKRIDSELLSAYDTMSRNGKTVTAQSLFDYINEKRSFANQIPTLVEAIDALIATKEPLVQIGEYHPKSYRDLFARKSHVIDFLGHKYKSKDIALDELKPNLGGDFELFLRAKKGHKSENVRKVTNFLSSVLKYAQNNEWTTRNVMDFYKKPKREINEPQSLTALEINNLKALDLPDGTTNVVRWQFVFLCYTAMNHIDLRKLTTNDIVADADGSTYIKRGRSKTTKTTFIPLVAASMAIIDQFKEHAQKTGFVFPVISNCNFAINE